MIGPPLCDRLLEIVPRTVCMESAHTSHPSPLFESEVTKTMENSEFFSTSKNEDNHQVCLGPSVFAVGLLESSRRQKSPASTRSVFVLGPFPRGGSVQYPAALFPASAEAKDTSVGHRFVILKVPLGCRRTWAGPGPSGPNGGCPQQRSTMLTRRSPRWNRAPSEGRTSPCSSVLARKSQVRGSPVRPPSLLRLARTAPAGPRSQKLSWGLCPGQISLPVWSPSVVPRGSRSTGSLRRGSGEPRSEWSGGQRQCRWCRRLTWRWAGGPERTRPGCRPVGHDPPPLRKPRHGRQGGGHASACWCHPRGRPERRHGNTHQFWLLQNVLKTRESERAIILTSECVHLQFSVGKCKWSKHCNAVNKNNVKVSDDVIIFLTNS